MTSDNRWKQRFGNFEKAYSQFTDAISIESPSKVELAGLVQIFNFTFELGWKTLKDLLELEGFSPKSPREVLKLAFQAGYVQDGQTWLDALEKRNLMTRTYDDAIAAEVLLLIRSRYSLILTQLNLFLVQKNA